MGRRFNDTSYLEQWKKDRTYPSIHSNIFNLISSTVESTSIVDICCSTGLLGQHVSDLGLDVFGVEYSETSIANAKKYGIEMPIYQMHIDRSSINDLCKLISENGATGLLARRCLSELFVARDGESIDFDWANIFSQKIIKAGIKEVWIEGRADQGRSTHPIPDTETEIKCLEGFFKVVDKYKKCAKLMPREYL